MWPLDRLVWRCGFPHAIAPLTAGAVRTGGRIVSIGRGYLCFAWRRVVVAAWLVLFAIGRAAAAPDSLPRYDLVVELDTDQHKADIRQRVTWTNTTKQPRSELVFNFYPHYQIPEENKLLLAKTLEMLRLPPSELFDKRGGHGVVSDVRVVFVDPARPQAAESLSHSFAETNSTALTIPLPKAVQPGESVTIELMVTIHLPNKQGRWGYWNGVTFLTNALPVLAFCDDTGWRPMPFVPWHQPWFNEAGVYRATIVLPTAERLACPAVVRSEKDLGDGRKQIDTEPFIGRDFAVLCSERYHEFQGETKLPDGRSVKLKCLAFQEHEFYATELLKIVGEAITIYSKWFGAFPYPQFTVAESFFGWNGNECAGLILIDERVFGMPKVGRDYVEYLASHETCHQWWYNQVGTNGFSETFLDEAAATYFTHRMLDMKKGPNNPLIKWPDELQWLPNMKRENYRWAYMMGAIRKGEMQPAAQDLTKYGHVFQLFTGAYDRGSKVFGMIETQLGEAAFMDFIQMLVKKYQFKVIQVADFRRELEEYTGRDWKEFFERWVYGKGMTDWKVEDVTVQQASWTPFLNRPVTALDRVVAAVYPEFSRSTGLPNHRTTAIIRQNGDFTETTFVSIDSGHGGPSIQIPIGESEPREFPEQRAKVTPVDERTWRVDVETLFEPAQITVDPDRVLVDSDLGNNRWQPAKPRWHWDALYTMLDETDLTNDYDRWNFGAGPWVGGALYPDPWYTRSTMVGARLGAYRTQVFSGGAYAAYRTDYRDAVIGVDGMWDHCLHPRVQIGFNYERRIIEPIGTNATSGAQRGSLYARYVLQYGSSMYLPPMNYIEAFTTYTDNFLPYARTPSPNGQRPSWWETTGAHYRLNMYTPYWDPESGFWVDGWASGGVARIDGQTASVVQGRGEFAAVQRLPEEWGPILGQTRAAGRIVVEGASPDRGEFFALGGGTLFRGYDLAQRQGSFLWVANLELRFPIVRDVHWDVLDHVAGGRNLYLATFYDVGSIYTDGRQVGTNVAHAVGAGLRLDTAIFSFIERCTLRFDVGKTINDNTPFQFWFGVQHAF